MCEIRIAYEMPMHSGEEAVAAVDRMGEEVKKFESSMVIEVHELFRDTVAQCFDRSLITKTP